MSKTKFCCWYPPSLSVSHLSELMTQGSDVYQRFSNCKTCVRREAKILRDIKNTGACQCPKNNGKLLIVLWLTALASSTQSAVAAAVVTQLMQAI